MKYFSGLLSILEEQTRCYETIYQLKEKEQELLVSGPPEAIQSNTAEIDACTLTIRSLEKARMELMEALAQQFGLDAESLSFQRVLELAEADESEELQAISTRLIDVLDRTSQINEGNAFLIRRSLEVIDRSLDLISGLGSQRQTYGLDGRMDSHKNANLLLNRQA